MNGGATVTPALLSVRDAAVYLGVPPETVRWWIRTGKLHRVKIGRRVLIRRKDLDALIVMSTDEARERPRRPRDGHQELAGVPGALEGHLLCSEPSDADQLELRLLGCFRQLDAERREWLTRIVASLSTRSVMPTIATRGTRNPSPRKTLLQPC